MANTIKTLSDGDITRKALSILHNKLVFCKTINREYDDRFARSGAKNGGTLLIRNPNEFTVRSGAIMDAQDVTESTQTLTLATQRGVDVNFSSVELTLSLDDFADRILEPAMARLAAEMDKIVIAACYPVVANTANTTLGTAPVLADLLTARAKLNKSLAPRSNRACLVESLAANSIINDGKALFHSATELEKHYSEGVLGRIVGFDFYESETAPTHTNGNRTKATTTEITCSTTAGITSGDATITLDALLTTTTFAAGDVISIAGVKDVNQETKAVYAHEKQFAITTALAAPGLTTATIEVSPVPVTSGAKQNCSIETGSATASVYVIDATRTSGAASTGYVNSLAYHRDAFTMVSADLEMPQGVDFAAREVYDGISLRVVRQYDINNDKFPCRLDVLFGQLATRPGWAARIIS